MRSLATGCSGWLKVYELLFSLYTALANAAAVSPFAVVRCKDKCCSAARAPLLSGCAQLLHHPAVSCRPYGVATLLAVYDKSGPQLYLIEPSGTAYRYFGTAVGKGRQSVKTEIERLKFDQLTCRQAVVECAKVLYKVHEEDGKPFELEMSWICEESGRKHQRVPPELIAEAEQQAKAAAEDSDMED
eukprot:GHUV01022114.1.p1 GENE.GHUV01022114.1~~GHUV01022114.1.p1  ORF type:complete len:187 (+),score=64.52 GHUV01022114.1:377-937(+)